MNIVIAVVLMFQWIMWQFRVHVKHAIKNTFRILQTAFISSNNYTIGQNLTLKLKLMILVFPSTFSII
jgi:hypothetical protein